MRLLLMCWFVCATTAWADNLDTDPLAHDPVPRALPQETKPHIPPIDVRIELARLNPQYVLSHGLDIQQIQKDGVLIQDYQIAERNRNPFYGLNFKEPLEPRHISLFVLMNLLDVYTTMEGSSYPCVVEVNPLLPHKPSLEELLLLKSLVGWLLLDHNLDGAIDADVDLIEANTYVTGIAVANNYDVIDRAMQTCPR